MDKQKIKPNGLGTAGLVLATLGSMGLIILSIFILVDPSAIIYDHEYFGNLIYIWPSIAIAVSTLALPLYAAAFNDFDKYKVAAGVVGLILGGIIGGIFILLSDSKLVSINN